MPLQVQKFSYLHAQLQGDAAHVISGLPLTETNYMHSVALLRERFGPQYKLVDAHIEAYWMCPPHWTLWPVYSPFMTQSKAIWGHFQHLESHLILMVASLAQLFWVSYQLKSKHKWHYDIEWTINALMASILKEIQIFEAGQHSGWKATSMSTTSFFYLATNRGTTCDHDKPQWIPLVSFVRECTNPTYVPQYHVSKNISSILKMQVYVSTAWDTTKCLNALQDSNVKNAIRNITLAFVIPSPPTLSRPYKQHRDSWGSWSGTSQHYWFIWTPSPYICDKI